MKVLWFSHISLSMGKNDKFVYPGGNWISSLKSLFSGDNSVSLAIAFWGDEDSVWIDENGITFYQIKKKTVSKITNYYYNWQHKIDSYSQIQRLMLPVNAFKPDIIQIFGTEGVFGKISNLTNVPVIIHIQGILNPYLNAWNIPGYSVSSKLKSMNFLLFLKGHGFFHSLYLLRKMAIREEYIFKSNNFFMGRTHWDKAMSEMYSPQSNYFHCDEVLRDSFYNNQWMLPTHTNKVIISSTINATIFKGLDLILKTANLLKKYYTIDFEWHVYGIREKSEYSKLVNNITGLEFDLNNVILRGVTPESELLEGLLKSNFFIHPSYIDNSPNSVCEAQLIGLPVISTNVGGISSLIKDGYNGFLVPSNEPHILAHKIASLTNKSNQVLEISKNAFSDAHKRHDKTKIKSDLIKIYNDIINMSMR